MKDFPDFMKNKLNAIAEGDSTGIEGYVYDGADGSQIIFWSCHEDGVSHEDVHEFDEYFIVLSGKFDLFINNKIISLTAGMEYYIPKGVFHSGEFINGTRTIHAFSGQRAKRMLIAEK